MAKSPDRDDSLANGTDRPTFMLLDSFQCVDELPAADDLPAPPSGLGAEAADRLRTALLVECAAATTWMWRNDSDDRLPGKLVGQDIEPYLELAMPGVRRYVGDVDAENIEQLFAGFLEPARDAYPVRPHPEANIRNMERWELDKDGRSFRPSALNLRYAMDSDRPEDLRPARRKYQDRELAEFSLPNDKGAAEGRTLRISMTSSGRAGEITGSKEWCIKYGELGDRSPELEVEHRARVFQAHLLNVARLLYWGRHQEGIEAVEDNDVATGADGESLSVLARECLQATEALHATEQALLRTAEDIAQRVSPELHKDNIKHAMTKLVKFGFLKSTTGLKGGYWLTEKGRRALRD